MSEWQPIETAPTDGTWILAFCVGFGTIPAVVSWHKYGECWVTCEEQHELEDAYSRQEQDVIINRNAHWGLTHWMPLPPPPESDG